MASTTKYLKDKDFSISFLLIQFILFEITIVFVIIPFKLILQETTTETEILCKRKHCSPESFCASGKFECGTYLQPRTKIFIQYFCKTILDIVSLSGIFLILEDLQQIFKIFGLSGNFPDCMDNFHFIYKLFGLSETFQFIWKVSRLSGGFLANLKRKFPDCLRSFEIVWKVSNSFGKFSLYVESFWIELKISS